MNIKSILNRVSLGVGLLVLSWGSQAQIVGSDHDLSSGGGAQGTGTTDQVCIYCHTPHASDTAAPAPLWNKTLPTGTTYTRYSDLGTASFDSTEAPVGSVSLACLSCHDGGQSMDVVVNLPGSGQGTAPRQIDGGTRTMTNPAGEFVPMLGTDLTNDHPVSMQYAGGGIDTVSHTLGPAETQSAAALGDPDFVQPFGATINGNPVWWVNTTAGASNLRQKNDMLLYTRTIATNPEPLVECGSCHDPHNTSTAAADQVAFLRIDNADSAVCTACHIK
jgi:hypothetical protein